LKIFLDYEGEKNMDQMIENAQTVVCPFLGYKDVPAAMAWLSAAFGFRQGAVIPSSGKSIVHAEMHVGDGVIILETAPQITTSLAPAWEAPGTHGIYVYVEDVDTQFRRAQAAGAKIVRTIEETIWKNGTRSFRVLDPEGYQWCFGDYKPSTASR
jgi:uncharacterized glyoxalase superfamily protein PhnB